MAERFKRLFHDTKEIHTIGSPVSVVGRALLWDNVTGKEISQIKLKNLFADRIKAVLVLIKTYDTAGEFMGDIQYEYKDLLVNQYETFGDQIAIGVENDSVRLFDVYISRVVYENGEVWKSQAEENYGIEDEVSLERFLGDSTLVEQYRLKYGTTARAVPRFYNDIWICTCGQTNRIGDIVCTKCEKSKERMLEDLDKDILAEEYRSSQYEKAVELYQKGGEQNCNAACVIFQNLQGYKDVEYIYAQCADTANKERVWREYNECIEIVSNGDISSLEQAIGYLERLGDYQDAKTYALQGAERIKRLKAEEEENKRAREFEENKKKRKKAARRITSVVAAVATITIITLCIYLHKENVRKQELEAKEQLVEELILSGDYNEARKILEELSDSVEISSTMEETYYQEAKSYIEKGDLTNARLVIEASDGGDKIEEIKEEIYFLEGNNYFQLGEYKKAIYCLENAGEREDIIGLLYEAYYKYAEELVEDKQYSAARDLLEGLEINEKTTEIIMESWYQEGKKLLNSGDYSGAITALENCESYENTNELLDEARWQQEIQEQEILIEDIEVAMFKGEFNKVNEMIKDISPEDIAKNEYVRNFTVLWNDVDKQYVGLWKEDEYGKSVYFGLKYDGHEIKYVAVAIKAESYNTFTLEDIKNRTVDLERNGNRLIYSGAFAYEFSSNGNKMECYNWSNSLTDGNYTWKKSLYDGTYRRQ